MKINHFRSGLTILQEKLNMESIAENTEKSNTEIKDLPADQCHSMTHLEGLDDKISERQEQIELCTMILNDLLEIQNIVATSGLENASLRGLDK